MQENKAVKSCLHPLEGAQETWHILPNPLCPLQKYGVAEGRPLADLKAMAKDAGEQCPSFTPSGGETLDEVWYLFIYLFVPCFLGFFISAIAAIGSFLLRAQHNQGYFLS